MSERDELIVLCAGCAGFSHCDGVEGGCDCTCGWSPDWAGEDDEWAEYCTPHCPDDVCRNSGHCAWPASTKAARHEEQTIRLYEQAAAAPVVREGEQT